MANSNPNTSGLKQFSSTYQPKKNGRKPNILKKYIKDVGISSDDISSINKYIFSLSLDQLKALIKDSSQPAIIIALATAVLKDIVNGKLGNIDNLLSKAKINPKDDSGDSGGGMGSGHNDSVDENQFHEYNFPTADILE